MLTMHEHDPGSTGFLSRTLPYHLPADLVKDFTIRASNQYEPSLQHHLYPLYHNHLQCPPYYQETLDQLPFHQRMPLPQTESSVNPTHPQHAYSRQDTSETRTATYLPPHYQSPSHHEIQLNAHQTYAASCSALPHHLALTGGSNSHSHVNGDSVDVDDEDDDDYEDDVEDVDEDDISESEDAELLHTYQQFRLRIQAPDVTSQLLSFAENVSSDIQKFFGRSKGQEDGCDIYEDKWIETKSGRELYYADLLRIAKGDSEPANKTAKKSFPSSSSASHHSSSNTIRCKQSRFSGIRNSLVGIGPLDELFQFGLQRCANQKKLYKSKGPRRNAHITPMQARHFPASFWREPCGSSSCIELCPPGAYCTPSVEGSYRVPAFAANESRGSACPTYVLHPQSADTTQAPSASTKLPDFTDLVERWHGAGVGQVTSPHARPGRRYGLDETPDLPHQL